MKHFALYHPAVLFAYFAGVLAVSVMTLNPIIIGSSYLAAVLLSGVWGGGRRLAGSLGYSLPLMLALAALTPIFVHRGETILFFLNDNPVTLEAISRGAAVAVLAVGVFYWLKCYAAVMTSDKFVYLFGRVAPRLGLALSRTLCFLPRFARRMSEVEEARKGLGIYTSKSLVDRARARIRTLSAMATWSVESAANAGDSMRARGYGLKGRTSFSLFRWRARDSAALFAVLALTALCVTAALLGGGAYFYYPYLAKLNFGCAAVALYLAAFCLMALAAAVEAGESIKWKLLRSRI